MRAMILAAGLGTRLRPLTFARPKVLVPVLGTTILEYWAWQLHDAGFEAVVVNAFHLHRGLVTWIREKSWPIRVEVRAEPDLLGTGGGIRNVLEFFDGDPFVVINGDIICNVSLGDLYRHHLESGGFASLLLHDHPLFNNVAVSREDGILGFGQEASRLASESKDVHLLAFTGIHVIHPSVLERMMPGTSEDILTLYRLLIEEGHPPRALFADELYWREMGSVRAYQGLNEELCSLRESFLPPLQTGRRVLVHPMAEVASGVSMKGFASVGKGSQIMEDVEIENTILWDYVRIERGARLRNCIVTDGVTVRGVHEDEVLYEAGE